jgi:plasmid stabilization system protein ParE
VTSTKSTTYNILFSDIADSDLEKAIDYYNRKSENGANTFKQELNQVLDTLELNPFFQFRYNKIRAVPFKTLPYLVFFEIYESEKLVYVYSIFHTAQNPNKYPL